MSRTNLAINVVVLTGALVAGYVVGSRSAESSNTDSPEPSQNQPARPPHVQSRTYASIQRLPMRMRIAAKIKQDGPKIKTEKQLDDYLATLVAKVKKTGKSTPMEGVVGMNIIKGFAGLSPEEKSKKGMDFIVTLNKIMLSKQKHEYAPTPLPQQPVRSGQKN